LFFVALKMSTLHFTSKIIKIDLIVKLRNIYIEKAITFCPYQVF